MPISIQIYITKFHGTQLDIKTASSRIQLKHGTHLDIKTASSLSLLKHGTT